MIKLDESRIRSRKTRTHARVPQSLAITDGQRKVRRDLVARRADSIAAKELEALSKVALTAYTEGLSKFEDKGF